VDHRRGQHVEDVGRERHQAEEHHQHHRSRLDDTAAQFDQVRDEGVFGLGVFFSHGFGAF